jgi:hypothetical protein
MEEAEAVYRQIRVPSKVIKVWETDNPHGDPFLLCALEDGRVYQSVKIPCTKGEGPDKPLANYTREWYLHTPAVPDR